MEVRPWCDVTSVEQRVDHTQKSEDLQGPRVHDECPRGPERLGALLDQAHRGAVIGGL
jgi:hypothetical protein